MFYRFVLFLLGLSSLGYTTQPDLKEKTLKLIFDDNLLRQQDGVPIIIGVASSYEGMQIAWQFMKEQYIGFDGLLMICSWTEVYNRYKSMFMMTALIEGTVAKFSSEEMKVDIQKFFQTAITTGAEKVINSSLEHVSIRIKQMAKSVEGIAAYLDAF